MKTVLLISQAFPPIGHVASKRAGCMAKYLSAFGWRPIVVCQQWTDDNAYYDPGHNCFYDPNFVVNLRSDLSVTPIPMKKFVPHSMDHLIDHPRRFFLPHRRPASFVAGAKARIPELYDKFQFDAVWATAPHAATHHLAQWTSLRYGVPWVADFRDVIGQAWDGVLTAMINPARHFYQRRYIPSASAITAATEGFADYLRGWHGREVSVIDNGFDPDDMAETPDTPVDKFRIVYTGGFTHDRSYFRDLLDGIDLLVNAGKMDPADVSVDFYGKNCESFLTPYFVGHPRAGLVTYTKSVPREECVGAQRSAAVLLQNAFPGRQGIMTGKLLEYLAARRPVLVLPSDGETIDRVMAETKAGVSCSSGEEVAKTLGAWYREWKTSGTVRCQGDLDAVMFYSRKRQAGQLADILDKITALKKGK